MAKNMWKNILKPISSYRKTGMDYHQLRHQVFYLQTEVWVFLQYIQVNIWDPGNSLSEYTKTGLDLHSLELVIKEQ